MPQSAETIFRDFTTDGIPASGRHEPRKVDIREWGTALEAFRDAGLSSGSSAIYDTRANLEANLVWVANTLAWVISDPTAANNGIYRKIGSSGSGSWSRVADLPYSFIRASDVGDGTPNAIQATSSLPIPADATALIAVNIFEDNTGSPVTVSFNGGAPLTIKTSSGNDVSAGGLTAGMVVAGYVSGSTFRLLTDQASAAIVAAAEAAAAEAEGYAAGLNLPAIGSGDAGKTLIVKDDETGYELGQAASGIFTPLMYGAVGDGVADDTAALQDTIDDLPVGGVIDGLGKTYKVTGTVAGALTLKAHMTAQNIVLDFSDADNDGRMLMAVGSQDAAVVVSEGASAGENTLTVADASGFTAGDYVWLDSTELWDDWDDNCTKGEMHQIKSISGNDVTFKDPVLHAMGVTGLTLAKINFLENISLRNVTGIGHGVGSTGVQFGGEFRYVKNLHVENCNFTKFEGRAFWPWRCLNATFVSNYIGECRATGTSYGIQIAGGSYYTKVIGNHFFDCRHGVDFGDRYGVSRYAIISGNTCTAMRGSGLSTHTGADFVTFSDNIVECDATLAIEDGIYIRSPNTIVSGNIVRTPGRYGIVVQGNVNSVLGFARVENNHVEGVPGTYGIYVNNPTAATTGCLNRVVVKGNTVIGSDLLSSIGIYLLSQSQSVKSFICTDNNVVGFRRGLFSFVNAGLAIEQSVISNNIFDCGSSGTEGIYVNSGTDGNNANLTVTGNVVKGPTTRHFRGVNEENLVLVGNNFRGGTIEKTATNVVDANNLI